MQQDCYIPVLRAKEGLRKRLQLTESMPRKKMHKMYRWPCDQPPVCHFFASNRMQLPLLSSLVFFFLLGYNHKSIKRPLQIQPGWWHKPLAFSFGVSISVERKQSIGVASLQTPVT